MQDRAEQKDKSQENQNLTFLFGEMKHGGSREGKPVGFLGIKLQYSRAY